jgi:hypothetical protein
MTRIICQKKKRGIQEGWASSPLKAQLMLSEEKNPVLFLFEKPFTVSFYSQGGITDGWPENYYYYS